MQESPDTALLVGCMQSNRHYVEPNQEINKAVGMANNGQHRDACDIFSQIVVKEPGNNFLLLNLASVCVVLNEFAQAEKHLDSFLSNDEKQYFDFYLVAIELYVMIARQNKAVTCSEQLVKHQPNNAIAYEQLAHTTHSGRDTKRAIVAAKKSIEIEPRNLEVKVLLAYMLSTQGEFEQAESIYKEVLSHVPNHANAIHGIVKCRKYASGDALFPMLDKALGYDMSEEDRAKILYATAKVYNDIEEYDAAWKYAQSANELNGKIVPFSTDAYQSYLDKLIDTYKKIDFEQLDAGCDDEHILIMGMPRSGTTLTEQILSNDPNLYPGGEKQGLEYAILLGLGDGDHLDALLTADKQQIQKMTDYYRVYFQQFLNFRGTRIIDKVPNNFLYLGLFKLMFKNIKIINLQRNVLDVTTSIFFENFSFKLNYTNDIDDILFVYTQYKRMMAFWESIFPENILTINYEDMTADYQKTSQKIVDFCNLDITNTDYSSSDNAVETPSIWQVRQGIYKSSNERWKRYSKYLDKYQHMLA